MIYLDSSFFIALALKNDHWHQKARIIIPIIEESEKMTSVLNLSEAVTLVGNLGGGKKGKLAYDYLKDNCHIKYLDQNLSDKSMETFLHYDGTLSFADSVSLELMKTYKILEIVSFDSDFDKVIGINRIH